MYQIISQPLSLVTRQIQRLVFMFSVSTLSPLPRTAPSAHALHGLQRGKPEATTVRFPAPLLLFSSEKKMVVVSGGDGRRRAVGEGAPTAWTRRCGTRASTAAAGPTATWRLRRGRTLVFPPGGGGGWSGAGCPLGFRGRGADGLVVWAELGAGWRVLGARPSSPARERAGVARTGE